jgi:SET domain-containing protein
MSSRECDPAVCKNCEVAFVTAQRQQLFGELPSVNNSTATAAAAATTTTGKASCRCTNNAISLGKHKELLVGVSDIKGAGFGLFVKYAVKKGEFLCEYVGEKITQEEADRRGPVYDRRNLSYLFNLDKDFAIDQHRKGNKSKFVNHGDANVANCTPKVVLCRGDHRIGIFALRDLKAQEELLFDYNYVPGKFDWTHMEDAQKAAKKKER